jgi:hypothetical protein
LGQLTAREHLLRAGDVLDEDVKPTVILVDPLSQSLDLIGLEMVDPQCDPGAAVAACCYCRHDQNSSCRDQVRHPPRIP